MNGTNKFAEGKEFDIAKLVLDIPALRQTALATQIPESRQCDGFGVKTLYHPDVLNTIKMLHGHDTITEYLDELLQR